MSDKSTQESIGYCNWFLDQLTGRPAQTQAVTVAVTSAVPKNKKPAWYAKEQAAYLEMQKTCIAIETEK